MKVRIDYPISDSTGATIVPAGTVGEVLRVVDSGLDVPDAVVRWSNGVESQIPADEVEPVE